jgi:hypothetical protein
LIADPQQPAGDYNGDDVVDAADYTVWRNKLGSEFELPNRAPGNEGPVSEADYDAWKSHFGDVAKSPYVFEVRGVDVNGKPPTNPPGGTYTPHVTFEFDRVNFLFGGALDADQAVFNDITVNKQTIETLDLLVNTNTGATTIRNNLASSFDINYYEITSESGSLREAGWTSLDSLEAGDPVGEGWDEAGGDNDAILSEANLLGFETLDQSDILSLGNAFRTVANGGTQGADDLEFFVGLTNGNVLRGTVTYVSSGSGSVVPEPATLALLLAGGLFSRLSGRKARRPGLGA